MIPLIVFITVFSSVLSLELSLYLYLKSIEVIHDDIKIPVCDSEIPGEYYDFYDDEEDLDIDLDFLNVPPSTKGKMGTLSYDV